MLYDVEIKGLIEKDVVFAQMTNNTIVLCQNSDLKYKLSKEFEKIMCGEADDEESNIRYSTGDMEEVGMRLEAVYMPTTIYTVNNGEQLIILTAEATSILSMENPDDLWFFGEMRRTGELEVYAFSEFKGHGEVWEKGGAKEVYKEVLRGIYGTYEEYGK